MNPFEHTPVLTQRTRTWRSDQRALPLHDTVHSMGNGEMLLMAQGADITTVWGPPYSAPNAMSIHTEADGLVIDTARRELHTAIWHHELNLNGVEAMRYIEYAAAGISAFIRHFKCEHEGVRWVFRPLSSGVFEPSPTLGGSWQLILRPGGLISGQYPTELWSHYIITFEGSCTAEAGPDGSMVVSLQPGEGSMSMVGATEYPNAVLYTERLQDAGAVSFLPYTRDYWNQFTQRRLQAKPELQCITGSAGEDLDGIAVMIRTQTSKEGGSTVGAVLQMGYIRDGYGASRGMLALGMYEEAVRAIRWRYDKYQHFGNLLTAEAMGTNCARHNHENDEVEGPAYTILQVRDYVIEVGSDQIARDVWPMLEWCFNVQLKHLAGGMLPFNGDETYVAGGFFPRSGLNQGSADTTMAFETSGQWLVNWAETNGYWSQQQAETNRQYIERARAAYREHFIATDRIWANEPLREDLVPAPRFRHGVCETLTVPVLSWTERTPSGRYISPQATLRELPAHKQGRTEVHSVSLLPNYLGSDIITRDELQVVVNRVLAAKLPNGLVPTVPGGKGFVGYDTGLLLLSLTELDDQAAEACYHTMMGTIDPAGCWNEYYDNEGVPTCPSIRANMWSSGVNAEAAMKFLVRAATR